MSSSSRENCKIKSEEEKRQAMLSNLKCSPSKNKIVSQQFLEACRMGRSERVSYYLSHGADVNATYQYDPTTGWVARGMSGPVYMPRGGESSGLMLACLLGYPSVVSRLVEEQDLDINFQDKDGFTAAYLAVKMGLTECISALARVDTVDWTKADKNGYTPLYWALYNGNTKIVDIIVSQSNIDYNVITNDGYTLSDAATQWTRESFAAIRVNMSPVAVTPARVGFMQMLARQKKYNNWNVVNKFGDSAIMKAVKLNQSEIVEILLKCPRVDLDPVVRHRSGTVKSNFNFTGRCTWLGHNQLEAITTDTLVLDKLCTIRSILQRAILHDSHLIRQDKKVSKLQSLVRDSILLTLSANNTQERLVKPLVDKLKDKLPTMLMDFLKAPYSERDESLLTVENRKKEAEAENRRRRYFRFRSVYLNLLEPIFIYI